MTTERRRFLRMRRLLSARICFNGRWSTMDCVVRNMSDGGAMLEFPGSVMLPHGFDLEIAERESSYKASLCWQDGKRAGVAFPAA